MRYKKAHYTCVGLIGVLWLSGTLQVVWAQNSVSGVNTTQTDNATMITGTTPLLPPEIVTVSRQQDGTVVFVDAGIYRNDTVYAYRIYRRCGDAVWWSLAKISIRECGGFSCTYKVADTKDGDMCDYSVSSVDLAGKESEQTQAQKVSVSEVTIAVASSSRNVDQNIAPVSTVGTRYTVAGKYVIYLRTQHAQSIEWSMSPDGSKTMVYLGKATYNEATDYWEYIWDTTKVPNGEYVLSPKIYSTVGQKYEYAPMLVQVKNNVALKPTGEDQALADTIQQTAKEAVTVVDTDVQKEQLAKEEVVEIFDLYAEHAKTRADAKGEPVAKQELIAEQERLQKEITTLLNIESSKLLRVLNGDEEEFKRFENKIIIASEASTKNIDAIAQEFGIKLSQDELDALTKEVEQKLDELEGVIKEKRDILKGRVGDTVFEDTDEDGISNYDEVNIYKTNPLAADTDGDSFFDGAEILGGFDPLNATRQAIIEYEQPRTDGFVEDTTFVVDSVRVTETAKNKNGIEDASKILFEGIAPANSFVTLYVYSTPIIVTIKTDTDGGWLYELDKELENGNHEVYVAITDNAGKIFAKSKPLPFVKEAAAVTIDEVALVNMETNSAKSIFNHVYMYGIGLLIIALIGGALVVSGRQSRL